MDRWNEENLFIFPREYFDKISDTSFVACVGYVLDGSDINGEINIPQLHVTVRARFQEYYRPEKRDKAIQFVRDGEWDYL